MTARRNRRKRKTAPRRRWRTGGGRGGKVCGMSVRRERSGQALLAVILILSIVLLLGGAALTLAAGSKQVTLLQAERSHAYYIADAGIEMYLAALKQQPEDPWAVTVPGEFAGGSLELTVSEVRAAADGTEVYLESTGRFGQAVQRIKAGVLVTRSLDFASGIWTASPPEAPSQFGHNARIGADVRANGRLAVANNARLDGNVWAGGLSLLHNATINGDIRSDGDVTIENNGNPTGNIYVRGRVTLGHNARVGGDIEATGDVAVANNLRLGGGITSGGTVDLGYHAALSGSIRANGPVTLANHAGVGGGVWAGGRAFLGHHAQVTGDVWSLGDVEMLNHVRVGGAVQANGTISKGWHVSVGGGEFAHQNNYFHFAVDPVVEVPAFPELDDSWYRAHATGTHQGNQAWQLAGETWEGVHLVDGDLTISGTYRGYATIYVTGDIVIPQNLKVQGAGALLLITPRDVRVAGNKRVDAFLFADGRAVLDHNARLYGGLIARVLEVRHNVEIHHRPEMYHAALKAHTVQVQMMYWRQA